FGRAARRGLQARPLGRRGGDAAGARRRRDDGARRTGLGAVIHHPAGLPPAASLAVLLVAGVWAGTQNALAGGGSLAALPALLLSGLDARAANITSTLALFPGQVVTGVAGRKMVSGAEGLSFRRLAVISLIGGVAGAGLLLLTPSSVFEWMLPFLILAATVL